MTVIANNTFESIICNLKGALRYDTLEGRKYLVVPMAMLTEGVHAGNNGPLFYPADELRKNPQVWNHKPIVVYHPEKNGVGISACEVEILNTRKVGLMLNTKYDNKLRAEAWLDVDRLKTVDARVLTMLQQQLPIEVSTGLFTDNEETEGTWNGKQYVAIARNYRPDHLAILPDKIGACSVADGAGLFQLNEQAEQTYNSKWDQAKRDKLPKGNFGDPANKSFPVEDQEDLNNAAHLVGHAPDPSAVKRRLVSIAKRMGLKLPSTWETTNNELSHSDKRDAMSSLLRGKHQPKSNDSGPYLRDMYDDSAIYEFNGNMMKHGYTVDKTDKIALKGEPVPVRLESRYVAADGTVIGNSSFQEPTVMSTTQKDKKGLIDTLIANGGWEEIDRPVLDKFDDAKLIKLCDKLAPVSNAQTSTVTAPTVPAPAVTVNTGTPTIPTAKPLSQEEYIANMPVALRAVMQTGLQTLGAQKQNCIAAITSNKSNTFTKEFLETLELPQLQGMAQLAQNGSPQATAQGSVPMFIGQSNGYAPINENSGEAEEAYVAPTMNWSREKATA